MPQPRDDGRDDAQRQAVATDHRAERGERHRRADQPVQGSAQVREPSQRDRGGYRQLDHREAWVEPGQPWPPAAAGVGPEQPVDEQADSERGDSGQRHLADRGELRNEEAEEDEGDDDPEGTDEPQRGDQPADARRGGESSSAMWTSIEVLARPAGRR